MLSNIAYVYVVIIIIIIIIKRFMQEDVLIKLQYSWHMLSYNWI